MMKTAVIFYSWSGHSKRIAEERAKKEEAQVYEIKDHRRPGALKAYTAGCLLAMRMKKSPVEAFDIPFDDYDHIIIIAPVWAGYPAPAINNVFEALPPDRNVTVCVVSASGASRCRDKVATLVRSRGCKFIGFENIKG